jgi:ribonucleotide monophosphatase NagD (HAD superfamily)
MLLNIAYNILSNISFNHLFLYTEKIIGNYQCRVWPDRFTVSQTFTIRYILENTKGHKICLQHRFIDFQAAYDTIKREKLYAATEDFGFSKKLIKMVQLTMKNSTCSIMVQSTLSA